METLSSDSRQPPDGHEFPDYIESSTDHTESNFIRKNYQDIFGQQLDGRTLKSTLVKTFKSEENVNSSQPKSSFNDYLKENKSPLLKMNSISNSDLSSINSTDPFDSGGEEVTLRQGSLKPELHMRSQSLIDMSSISKQKSDRWSSLVEQRKKGYSKLKGLVIPEHVTENDPAPAVNIPEIISHTAPTFVPETKTNANETIQCHSNETEPVTLPLASPPWTSSSTTFPKYSPAFKRKSLQVYSQSRIQKQEEPQIAINKLPVKDDKSAKIKHKIDSDELRLDNLSDSPKSLESITSPTRSDCSFDYVTNSFNKQKNTNKIYRETFNNTQKLHKDIGKSEDESDNDSAVSSSQSSYISRCSPSPTRSCETVDYDPNMQTKSETNQYANIQSRLLKAASVEAINRKNILASAKCRSGRDLKVGSPVIKRKYEEEDSSTIINTSETPKPPTEPPPVKPQTSPIAAKRIAPRRSVSVDESSTPKPTVNGVNKIFTPNDIKISSKSSSANQFKNFSAQLKETKIPPKTTYNKPNSLLKNNKPMSVTDIRKNFEKFGNTPPPLPQNVSVTVVKEKIDVKTSKSESSLSKRTNKVEGVVNVEIAKPLPASVQKQPEKAAKLSTETTNSQRTVTLCPEFLGGSIGITLAGGTDYETKEITVHKIRYGSVSYNNGNIKKGDRVLSVNGKSTTGLTHAESVEMLKEPVLKFEFVLEDSKEEPVTSPQRKSFIYEAPEQKSAGSALLEKNVTHVIRLTKEGPGLGFSIEGGKDSLQGDLPLRVKKIFQGGLAEKNEELQVGDELLAINDISVINLSRIETWSLMKKLPDGIVNIHIHR